MKVKQSIWRIVFESVGILIIASIISSFGGVGIENIKNKLVHLVPLLMLIPVLNDLIGDFGTIIASRFTEMLYRRQITEKHIFAREMKHTVITLVLVSFVASFYSTSLAYFFASFKGFPFDFFIFGKILFITLITIAVIVSILFLVSIFGGFYVYKRHHDPDNYLIPFATAIADLGTMFLLSFLVTWLF